MPNENDNPAADSAPINEEPQRSPKDKAGRTPSEKRHGLHAGLRARAKSDAKVDRVIVNKTVRKHSPW